ncbi:MAG: pentapeptide repeat-containing protein [Pseudomonadota bacterium]
MRTITIRAIEAVKCIRSGMTDAALMDEFQISARGLQILFSQLIKAGILTPAELEARVGLSHGSVDVDLKLEKFPAAQVRKPVIDAADALNCIRSGMNDAALMKRYNLSAKGIQSLLAKLTAIGILCQSDMDHRNPANNKSIVLDEEAERPPGDGEEGVNVDTTEILNRLRLGAPHESIVEGYGLSLPELDGLLDGLVTAGVLTKQELIETLHRTIKTFEIKNRFTGEDIYSGESPSIAALVEQAVRAGVDLTEASLPGVNLAGAVLSGARLIRADLRKVSLVRADLTGAKLAEATLASADMTGAILYKANFAGADLSDANMSMVYAVWVFLAGANLSETNLSNADLSGANLGGTQMFETILDGTNLRGAYLRSFDS